MSTELLVLLFTGVFTMALLYSSVGHAGASGYIAVMSLLSLAPATIKPTALALNILVASIAAWRFGRAGYFRWALFWPFALLAIPLAFLGGHLDLPAWLFQRLLGAVLLFSAWRLFAQAGPERDTRAPPWWGAMLCGGAIGLLAGLTGTGGGIFLTPLLLFAGWAKAKEAAAVSALFILCNSVAGLLGNWANTSSLPTFIWPLMAVAAVGGWLGSGFGSQRFAPALIKRFLGAVLVVAGLKLLLT
jgi:uncharacterized membrane protein YfcA